MTPTARGKLKSEIEAIEGALHDSWSRADRLTAILAAADKYAEEQVKYELDRTLQDCIWADDIEHLKKMLANRITAQPQQQAMKGESDVN